MKKEDKKSFVKSLIETDENIHLFLILLSIVGLFGFYFWLSYNPRILGARSISKEELTGMSAKEYIAMMQQTSILVIPKNIPLWPKPEDIPYLLMLTESNQYAGSTISNFDDLNAVRDYESTVGITAVFLLKAITEGKFKPYMTHQYPADKDEIIKKATNVMKTGELIFHTPLAGEPEYYNHELVTLSAEEVIATLKTADILTLCSRDLQGPDSVVVVGWPRREDIRYLLSVIDSKERSGVFFWCHFSVIPFDDDSTVGDKALLLLNAIKLGEFDMRHPPKPENPQELLVWARAEAARMEQEKAQKQNTPLP